MMRRPENAVCFAHFKRPTRKCSARTNIGTSHFMKFGLPSMMRRAIEKSEMMFDALRHFRLPHRLMDFNNLPDTRFEDIHNVLRVATTRVATRLAANRWGWSDAQELQARVS